MPTERLAPDAILSSSNLSGSVTDIDEDPDSNDANWMVASSNNVATNVRTSLPTPTPTLTVGAGLQEFRACVRKFSSTQTGTPKARIELWENGGLIRAGSDVNVTSAVAQVIAFTWNASEIATSNGSLVECKVVGTQSGGSGSARNSTDVGALEWNATYTASSTTFLTLTPAGTGTNTVAKVNTNYRSLVSTGTGTSGLTKLTINVRSFAPAAVGTNTVSKVNNNYRTLTSTATGTESLTRLNNNYRTFTPSAIGTESLAKVNTNYRALTNSATGTENLTTALVYGRTFSASGVGTASLTDTLTAILNLTLSATGTANLLSAIASFFKSFTATSSGTSTVVKMLPKTLGTTAAGAGTIIKAKHTVHHPDAVGTIYFSKVVTYNDTGSSHTAGCTSFINLRSRQMRPRAGMRGRR